MVRTMGMKRQTDKKTNQTYLVAKKTWFPVNVPLTQPVYIYIYVCIYLSIYIYILVGGLNPSEKMKVSWEYYSQLNGTIKFMFQTTKQYFI